jgi:hypothetical protein
LAPEPDGGTKPGGITGFSYRVQGVERRRVELIKRVCLARVPFRRNGRHRVDRGDGDRRIRALPIFPCCLLKFVPVIDLHKLVVMGQLTS